LRETSQVDFRAFPTKALREIPKIKNVGDANRGESITAFSGRKRVLAVLFSAVPQSRPAKRKSFAEIVSMTH
jgi:hypothetical protein